MTYQQWRRITAGMPGRWRMLHVARMLAEGRAPGDAPKTRCLPLCQLPPRWEDVDECLGHLIPEAAQLIQEENLRYVAYTRSSWVTVLIEED